MLPGYPLWSLVTHSGPVQRAPSEAVRRTEKLEQMGDEKQKRTRAHTERAMETHKQQGGVPVLT